MGDEIMTQQAGSSPADSGAITIPFEPGEPRFWFRLAAHCALPLFHSSTLGRTVLLFVACALYRGSWPTVLELGLGLLLAAIVTAFELRELLKKMRALFREAPAVDRPADPLRRSVGWCDVVSVLLIPVIVDCVWRR